MTFTIGDLEVDPDGMPDDTYFYILCNEWAYFSKISKVDFVEILMR